MSARKGVTWGFWMLLVTPFVLLSTGLGLVLTSVKRSEKI